ncbi:aldehyde dehydrogenase family protein, partial [Vibrio parahaemolyticus]
MDRPAIKRYWQNFIDGAWVDGAAGGRIPIEDPARGEVIAEIAQATPADVDRAVAAARARFNARTLIDMRPSARGQMLLDIAQA